MWILVIFSQVLHDQTGKEGECKKMVVVSCLCFDPCIPTCLFVPLGEYLCLPLYRPRPLTDSPPRPRAARAGSARAAWRWIKALLRGSVGVNAWAPIRREDTKRADFMVASCSSSSGKEGARVRTVMRGVCGMGAGTTTHAKNSNARVV